MSTVATVISLAAAICTTAANLPQLKPFLSSIFFFLEANRALPNPGTKCQVTNALESAVSALLSRAERVKPTQVANFLEGAISW
jgi:hypothetical protein